MSTAVRSHIIKIGNSQGIRIPKLLLEQSGIHGKVEIEVQGDHLIIRSASRVREGWHKAFITMAQEQDDVLLDEVGATTWDESEWEW